MNCIGQIGLRLSVLASVFVISLSVSNPAQSSSQVRSDPSNPPPDFVLRNADKREELERMRRRSDPLETVRPTPEPQTLYHIEQAARQGAVRPGEHRQRGLSESDRKRIAALLTPNPHDIERYRQFLAQENTGIFRLYPDFDCGSKGVVSVAGDCEKQVYGGSTHSFRPGARFFDLGYNNGKLIGIGFFSHEILVDLGDVPLEGIALNSPGVDFLRSYVPSSEFVEAKAQYEKIAAGITSGGMLFSDRVVPQLDRTYAMRIVAFRNGNHIQKRSMRRGRPEPLLWSFRALHEDKRIDIIVAFRVVRVEEDGNITVVWKQLDRRKSPVITFEDEEEMKNLKGAADGTRK